MTKGPWTVEQLAHIIDALHYFNVHLNSDITKEAAFYINTIRLHPSAWILRYHLKVKSVIN